MEHDSNDGTHALYDQELLPNAGRCPFCNYLRRLFTEAEVLIDLSYGWDGQETPCPAHDGLLSWLEGNFYERDRYLSSQSLWLKVNQRVHTIRFMRRIGAPPEIQFLNQNMELLEQEFPSLFLTRISNESVSSSYQDSFDPDWIGIQSARQWLGDCVENHGLKCEDTLGAFSSTPAYLIDTAHNCIVEVETGFEYVALSYRWSRPDISFRTNRCNLANLIVPGGISKQSNIPHTINHAMHVVRLLGERYLWVDSLCIVCDDTKHCQEQLQIMGSIYACAKLTIVAADAGAWDGLHGIENVSQPRELPNVFAWLDGTKLAIRDLPALSAMHSRYEPGSTSEYFQRGWTFQEYVLSRRRLIFGKKQIHWMCACAIFHEDRSNHRQYPDDLPGPQTSMNMPNIFAGIPDFEELESVANEYHMRDFTHPEDALPGIIGLLDLLKYSFRGGFLCGLPLMRFDAALIWHCILGSNATNSGLAAGTFLEARKHSVDRKSSLPSAILPSLSWVSWRGKELSLLDREESYQLPDRIRDVLGDAQRNFITTPITTWYSQDTPFSQERWRIWSFADSKESCHDQRFVDQGWIQEPLDPFKRYPDCLDYLQDPYLGPANPDLALEVLKEAAEKPVYSHPDFPNKLFWRPFYRSASGEHDKYAEACELQQRQYISCRTQRNWFHARRIACESYAGGAPQAEPKTIHDVSFDAQIVVLDDSDQVCGWLQIPGEPSTDDFKDGSSNSIYLGSINLALEDSDPTNDKPPSRSKIELVAICCREKSTVLGRREGDKRFYGVLWVEWKDKVAYRRGCGFIEKSMWDQSGAEEVDLVLG